MDQPHDKYQPKRKQVTITIDFVYQQPESENNIPGGYVPETWCDNMEKLPTEAHNIIIETLTPKQ